MIMYGILISATLFFSLLRGGEYDLSHIKKNVKYEALTILRRHVG